ncbi:MAG: aminotransferase class I/II-fold pyridoxal phosphate-dependent enzyme, partial [Bacteroidota bacterium]
MRTLRDLVRPNIWALAPFSSARDEFTGRAEVFLDANENPFESHHNRYPDSDHRRLRAVIADWRSIPMDQILLGNGSDELIDMIVRTFCTPGVDEICTIAPTFGMYRVVAGINDVEYREAMLDDSFDLDVEQILSHISSTCKVLFLCTPNNPTGHSLSDDRIGQIVDRWPGIVVIDEAYIDFTDQVSWVSRLSDHPRVIVLQTFSKAMGAAGLRIGMCFASTDIISILRRIKPPYNLGAATQENALQLLADRHKIDRQISIVVGERKKLYEQMTRLRPFISPFPSDSNFILARCEDHLKLKQYL